MNPIIKDNIKEFFAQSHFFAGLRQEKIPYKERIELERESKTLRVSKKTIIYSEGEVPRGIYFLISGKIKISYLNPNGSVQVFFIYSHGDIFGHHSVLGDDKHTVNAVALEDSDLLFIDKDHFLNVVKNSDVLNELLLKSACHEHLVLGNRINVFAQKKIRERLAYFLLLLNEKYKLPEETRSETEIKLNRLELADYVGTSLENLVRNIKEFKNKNLIRTEGKSIYISDFEGLYAMTGI
jgi:CRP-like cAMP-binding protein